MAPSRSAEAGVLAKTKETLMHCLFLFCFVKYHKLPLRAPGQPAQFYGETIQLYIIACSPAARVVSPAAYQNTQMNSVNRHWTSQPVNLRASQRHPTIHGLVDLGMETIHQLRRRNNYAGSSYNNNTKNMSSLPVGSESTAEILH